MTQGELNEILEAHNKWLNGEEGGSRADLCLADLRCSDLRDADLSDAEGIQSAIDYMESKFESTNEGYIVYKTFNSLYSQSKNWDVRPGSILTETLTSIAQTDAVAESMLHHWNGCVRWK